jgi:hypothetical protein
MAIGINLSDDDDWDDDDSSMFAPVRKGSWWVSSKSDPRFNSSGRGYVGSFTCPKEAREFFEKRAKELGVPVPDDLEFGYMKD